MPNEGGSYQKVNWQSKLDELRNRFLLTVGESPVGSGSQHYSEAIRANVREIMNKRGWSHLQLGSLLDVAKKNRGHQVTRFLKGEIGWSSKNWESLLYVMGGDLFAISKIATPAAWAQGWVSAANEVPRIADIQLKEDVKELTIYDWNILVELNDYLCDEARKSGHQEPDGDDTYSNAVAFWGLVLSETDLRRSTIENALTKRPYLAARRPANPDFWNAFVRTWSIPSMLVLKAIPHPGSVHVR